LHTWSLSLEPGRYNLWLEDEFGNHFQRKFSILEQ
jgi:hypothetical protein